MSWSDRASIRLNFDFAFCVLMLVLMAVSAVARVASSRKLRSIDAMIDAEEVRD